ncbi:MAG: site-specific integrase, partial [Chlorobium sp.]|nr:site-specific integrase [Chlorobium sp.]
FKRSWRKDERILNYDVVPAWGNRKAEDIAKRDVVVLLEKIVDRGSPAIANNTFQIIRKMFNWAIEKDILPHTPCTGIKLPAPKVVCDRVLSEAEIKAFWINLDKCTMSPETRSALKLILITGQRSGEIIGMHTGEIDGDWWTIPAERAKNGKTHRVYLTSMAKELINRAVETVKQIRDIPGSQPYNGFVFPCPHQFKDQSVNATALAVAVGRNLAGGNNRFELEHFTPHDLRRTAATFMAESGEMDEVIDAILNHAKQGVIKVYNQYRYAKEKQSALEKWSRKLRQIVGVEEPETGKIMELRRMAP